MKIFGEILLCALVFVVLILGTPIIMIVSLIKFWINLFKCGTYTIDKIKRCINYSDRVVVCNGSDIPIWRGRFGDLTPEEIFKMEVFKVCSKDNELRIKLCDNKKNKKLIKQLNRRIVRYSDHLKDFPTECAVEVQ